ncbi:hypothetical protein AAVH_23654 [Aphelenchoides avenae]|nr:hypothetical protein AAVH_23654 [Aphelenchus avenae]
MQNFCETLVSEGHLVPKRLGNAFLTVREFFETLQRYADTFGDHILRKEQETASIITVNGNLRNIGLRQASRGQYEDCMRKELPKDIWTSINELHGTHRSGALQLFDDRAARMDGAAYEQLRAELGRDIQNAFLQIQDDRQQQRIVAMQADFRASCEAYKNSMGQLTKGGAKNPVDEKELEHLSQSAKNDVLEAFGKKYRPKLPQAELDTRVHELQEKLQKEFVEIEAGQNRKREDAKRHAAELEAAKAVAAKRVPERKVTKFRFVDGKLVKDVFTVSLKKAFKAIRYGMRRFKTGVSSAKRGAKRCIAKAARALRWKFVPWLEEKNNAALVQFWTATTIRQNAYAAKEYPTTVKCFSGDINWDGVKAHIQHCLFPAGTGKEFEAAATNVADSIKPLHNGEDFTLSSILQCCTSGSGNEDYQEFRLLRVEVGSYVYFFDKFLRRYTGWEHYCKTDTLMECYVSQPKDGTYTHLVDSNLYDIAKVKSSACGALRQLKRWAAFIAQVGTGQSLSTGRATRLSEGGLVLLAATVYSLLPVTFAACLGPVGAFLAWIVGSASVSIGATVVFGVAYIARSAYSQYDKCTHGISLCSVDSAMDWLSILLSLCSFALLGKTYFAEQILAKVCIGQARTITTSVHRLYTACTWLFDASCIGNLLLGIVSVLRAVYFWCTKSRNLWDVPGLLFSILRIALSCYNLSRSYETKFETSHDFVKRVSFQIVRGISAWFVT